MPGEYFRPETGAQYGVGVRSKLVLAAKLLRNNRAIPTGFSSLLAYAVKNPDTGTFRRVADTGEDNTADASLFDGS